jgi:hypothetical protein
LTVPKIAVIWIALVLLSLSASNAAAQEMKPKEILFHVTSVQRVDSAVECKAGNCSVVKYTVEGFADGQHDPMTTQYVITCDEHMADRPSPHRNNICARFHAGEAYMAQVQSDVVSFPFSRLNKAFETDYNIVSEKEIARSLEPARTGSQDQREATRVPEQHDTAKGPEQLASKEHN